MLVAKKCLRDAQQALNFLENETDEKKFKLLWISCITLLREVGHVLKKVDSQDSNTARVVSAVWNEIQKNKCENEIFHLFIDRERNLTIKEYQINVEQIFDIIAVYNKEVVHGDLGDCIYMPMVDGPWEGEDCRDVLQIAIDWWSNKLDRIEHLLSQAR